MELNNAYGERFLALCAIHKRNVNSYGRNNSDWLKCPIQDSGFMMQSIVSRIEVCHIHAPVERHADGHRVIFSTYKLTP
jgi:hypothetical protein